MYVWYFTEITVHLYFSFYLTSVSCVFKGIKRGATIHDLRELTEKLLAADVNGAKMNLSLDLQGKGMAEDLAPRPYDTCTLSYLAYVHKI